MTDRAHRAADVAMRAPSRFVRMLRRPFSMVSRLRQTGPTELVMAPQDIRTADPTHAEDIYAGVYVFGGRLVNGEGRAPFEIAAPSIEWARELAGFGWLRHMRAADTALARANARAIVSDYLAAAPRLRNGPAGEPAVVARRILSWLSQSPFLLRDADGEFYRAFMRGLGRDAAILTSSYGETQGFDRFVAAIALAELALCSHAPAPALKRASALVSEEAAQQIYADGGHVGRNPETLVELLLDLLPLRQTYVARQQPTPQAILNAIDRMIPMVRPLRHGEGSLALFNGMGLTEPDHLATVLAYDDARGRALLNAPHSGYQRLEGEDSIVIVDTGRPPPARLSSNAHAGCLSFELSAGPDRFVVNCGTPMPGKPAARDAARQTAAHSTMVLDDTSSCRFATDRNGAILRDAWILNGPTNVGVSRRELPDATVLEASHDGYARMFGIVHERRLALTRNGRRLIGQDRLASAAGADRAPKSCVLRFHIHPTVAIDPAADGRSVLLTGRAGTRLRFEATDSQMSVEESVFFAAPSGIQRTRQIVVSSAADADSAIDWSFTRVEA